MDVADLRRNVAAPIEVFGQELHETKRVLLKQPDGSYRELDQLGVSVVAGEVVLVLMPEDEPFLAKRERAWRETGHRDVRV